MAGFWNSATRMLCYAYAEEGTVQKWGLWENLFENVVNWWIFDEYFDVLSCADMSIVMSDIKYLCHTYIDES